MKKLISSTIVAMSILSAITITGCRSVSPKLQDEYIRPGLNLGMLRVFDEYRQTVSEMMTETKTPGVSLAIVDREGILWTAGFGYTDFDKKKPVTTDTLFLICSMSKTVTSVGVMIAVQDGLVDLDTPIIEYLPDFAVNSRFEEDAHKKITLRHLLSHTSGLAHEAPVGNAREASGVSLEEHVQSISDTWLRHKVGEGYNYSGLGYDLIAYILQVRSGKPFAEYMKEKVFIPLNMSKCSVDPEFIRQHPNRAIGHMSYVKQVPLAMDVPWVGAGSIYADAEGLANFMRFFLNDGRVDGKTVLGDGFITSMATPSIRTKDYGLGLTIYSNKYINLGHGGFGVGFSSDMYWAPEYGIGGVILHNSENARSDPDFYFRLIDEKLVEKDKSFQIPSVEHHPWQPPNPDTFTPFEPEWKKYVGTYKYALSGWKPGFLMKIGLALGLTTEYTHLKVFEKDGYLYVNSVVFHDDDGGRLNEHLPGLFFTPTGKCLDLRGPKLTWQNYRIKKVDNDTGRNFDIDF